MTKERRWAVLVMRAKIAFEDLVKTLRPLVTEQSLEAWLQALKTLPPLEFREPPQGVRERAQQAQSQESAEYVPPVAERLAALSEWLSETASSTATAKERPAESDPQPPQRVQ